MSDVLVTRVYTFDMQITVCFMYFRQLQENYSLIKDNETALHFIMVTIKEQKEMPS